MWEGGYKKVVKGSFPKTLLKDIIYNNATHTRRVLLTMDTYTQVLSVWKQVSLKILGSKIFFGLVALGAGMRCARVMVSLRALSQPVGNDGVLDYCTRTGVPLLG